MEKKTIKLGIGFATGRKAFRKVMNSYIYSWNEYNKNNHAGISISLFAAYDLSYSNTQSTDYTNLDQDIVDSFEEIVFISEKTLKRTAMELTEESGLTEEDIRLIFASGYAGKRNSILYAAIMHKMDYLLFLDDDEYPVAVTNTKERCLWSGQYIIPMHLETIANADITNGYHCGYISPIPNIRYNDLLSEKDFQKFIGAISNDVINWESIQSIMKNGGVTYADTSVLTSLQTFPLEEINHCKFITGSNLCINLTDPKRVFPFYNPPGARGEDTFLSTLLTDRTVVKVPSYTFHDGFSAYKHLLDGVLPIRLDEVAANSEAIVTRFYNACIGWVRYKPLLLHITDPEGAEEKIHLIQETLEEVLPKISAYFENENFLRLLPEFNKYSRNAKKHNKRFADTQDSWKRMMEYIDKEK